MNVYWVAAAWIGLALLASLISIRLGISVALVELVVGAVVGNIPGSEQVVQQTEFTNFLATLGSAVLTFLAGAEIDPESLRRNWKPSLTLGVVSFAAPFAGHCSSLVSCSPGHGQPRRSPASPCPRHRWQWCTR